MIEADACPRAAAHTPSRVIFGRRNNQDSADDFPDSRYLVRKIMDNPKFFMYRLPILGRLGGYLRSGNRTFAYDREPDFALFFEPPAQAGNR